MARTRPCVLLLCLLATAVALRAEDAVQPVLVDGHPVHPTRILARRAATTSPATQAAAFSAAALIPVRSSTLVPGLVVLEPDANAASAVFGDALTGDTALLPEENLLARIEMLRASGQFEYVEPDYLVVPAATPTDSGFTDGLLWGLLNDGRSGGIPGVDIGAPAAWNITTGSTDVIVAILDSGMRMTHVDLASQLWTNTGEIAGNGLDDDNNGYVDDRHGINALTHTGDPTDLEGHGTAVAGTIGAAANNGQPMVGVAWKVSLMPCRFLGTGGGATSDAIECIGYAIAHGARIINCSWGNDVYSQALYDTLAAARDANVVVVAAAGNTGMDTDVRPHYPSGFDFENIVSVAAHDRMGTLYMLSNRGVETVDLVAPGVGIYTTGVASDTSYRTTDGTSMAAAHVSGIAALVLAKMPSLSGIELRDRIVETTMPDVLLAERVASSGRAHAFSALALSPDGSMAFRVSPHPGRPLFGGHRVTITVRLTDITVVTGATVSGQVIGGAAFSFRDDGLAPDLHADDGTYSATMEVPTNGDAFSVDLTATAPGKAQSQRRVAYVIEPPPANDMFAAREVIPGLQYYDTTTNRGATREDGEPHHAGEPGGASIWWSWTAPADGGATISTRDSPIDTVLGVYTGTSLDTLTPVVSNDDLSDTNSGSAVEFFTVGGTTYQIAVDGAGGEIGGVWFHFRGTISPPNDKFSQAIPIETANAVVSGTTADALREPGEPEHTGTTTPSYGSVWWTWTAPESGTARMRSTPISGQGGEVLAVYVGAELGALRRLPRTSADSGNAITFPAQAGETYHIALANAMSPTGGTVTLSVALVPGPANDTFAGRIALTGYEATGSGDTTDATREFDEPNHLQAASPPTSGTSLWWTWTAPEDGSVELAVNGDGVLTVVSVYTGNTLGALVRVIDGYAMPGTIDAATLRFRVHAGVAYQIAVDTQRNRAGPVSLTLKHHVPPPNDQFAGRTSLSGTSISQRTSNVGATSEAGEPDHTQGVWSNIPARATLWWEWTAPADALVYASSGENTALTVYTGAALDALAPVTNLEWPTTRPNLTTFQATAGQRYILGVDGISNFTGSFDVGLFIASPPANDSFAGSTRLPSEGGTFAGEAVGATTEPGEPALFDNATASSVWFAWTAPVTGTASLRISGWVAHYGVFTGPSLGGLSFVAEQGGYSMEPLVFPVTAGVEYRILVDTKPGRARPYEIVLSSTAAPANDTFSNGTVLTGSDIVVQATNAGAWREPGEPTLTGETSGATVWWRWTAPRSGRAIVSAADSGFFPYLGVFTGTSVSSLTMVARSLDASNPANRHRVVFAATEGTTYHIAVQGYAMTSGTIALELDLVDAPTNDTFLRRTRLTGSEFTIEATNLGALPEPGDPAPVNQFAGLRTVWWRWTAPATGRFVIDTPIAPFLAQFGVYTGATLEGLVLVASNTQSDLQIVEDNVVFDAIAGTDYAIVLAGSLDEMGVFSLRMRTMTAPANDRWIHATPLPPEGGSASGTTLGASEDSDDAPGRARRTVWWTWTAPATGAAGVSTEGSDFDTYVAVYGHTPTSIFARITDNDDDARGGVTSRAPFSAVAGTTYYIQVGSAYGDMGSVALRLGMGQPPAKPVIAANPASPAETQPLTLGTASAEGMDYRWYKNYGEIPDARGPTLAIPYAQRFHDGSYQVTAYNLVGEATSDAFPLTISPAPASSARLMNLSTRALCQTGDSVLIPGFYIEGSGTKRLLMRAVGPELTGFGVPDALPDPQLVLKRQSDGSVLATNDDWGDNPNWEKIRDTARALYAFGLKAGSKSAALLLDLPAGGYTIVSSGHGDETGVAIVELYEAAGATESARLINISNRGFVGIGGNIMIPGFVVSDEGSRTFLIRAVGPTLTRFTVTGVLADPRLEIYKRRPGTTIDDLILANDTWGENGDADLVRESATAVHAFRLDEDSADAALVVTLPPGAYTVNAKGKDDATGVALVEVYLLP